MVGHYDRNTDIAWLRFQGWDPGRIRVEETDFGLCERDVETGRVLGLEYWSASRRLPEELLGALPAPPDRERIIER